MGIWFVHILAVVNVVAMNFGYKYEFRQKIMGEHKKILLKFCKFHFTNEFTFFHNIVPVNHAF